GLGNRSVLGPLALEELEARRRGVKQVGDLDGGAGAAGGGLGAADPAALDLDLPGAVGTCFAADDAQARNGADRGQGLAAEAQGGDFREVVALELGGGVALDAERK